jgi:DNA-binding winged helix-turn-helix (wHTH) protein
VSIALLFLKSASTVRRKLDGNGKRKLIDTVLGVGYKIGEHVALGQNFGGGSV